MSVSLSTFTEVALVNTTSASGIIVVPPANSIPYRVVVFKDRLGTFQTNSLTLSTQGGNTFEDGTTTKIVNTRFGFISLYSDGVSKWHTLNGSQLVSMNISSLIVSTIQGNGSQLTNVNAISTLSLVSSLVGLGTLGYVSTASLTSTVQGLGSANYVSTLSLVSTTQGLQTGYATAGFLSTANLISTVQGLGSAGYVSTTALGAYFSSVSTSYAVNFITSSLTFSTATGSNATISSVTANQILFGTGNGWIQAGAIQATVVSSVQINTNVLYANSNFFGTVSSQTALQFYGLQGNYNNTVIAEQSTGTGTQELLLFKGSSASDQVRIQTTGGFRLETGVSSRLWPTYTQAANPALYVDINSNVGIGTASPGALLDVVGQGRFQVVSTLQLNISSINGATFGSPINSTVIGLGSAGYVSTLSLVSTTAGILANISISGVLSTANLTSTVQGLGSANYVSSLSLVSTTQGLQNSYATAGFLSTANLQSTVEGLGTAGYASTSYVTGQISSFSTAIASAIASGGITATNLQSTVTGLGSAGYISSSQLISTVAGLNTYTSSFIDATELTSTISSLGTLGYVSSLSLVSTTQGLQNSYATAGFLSTANLTSTVAGLGTAGYVSTTALGAYFSSVSTSYALSFTTSSLIFSTATGSTATISSLAVNQLTFGTGSGWLQFGAVQAVAVSSIQLNTNSLYANSNFFGTVSSQTALQFYGLQGNYNNTVIAEQSTGTGTQELLLFKGSSASDQVRIQTTGGFRLETGVSSRLWPTYAQTANPAFYVDINSNVGIGTASPAALLDVVGQGRFQVVSTLQLNISSINGATFGSPINSTVIGLGSAGYVSTLSLVSTTAGIIANISVTGVLSTANLTSTVQGLGSAGYISSSQLVSTTQGLTTYISSFIDPAELTSTVVGLGTVGFISSIGFDSKLASTVQGLGTAGYVSSSQLVSTTESLTNTIAFGLSTLSTAIRLTPGYTAQTLYLNQSVTVAPYKELGAYQVIAPIQSTITSLPGNTNSNLLASFQTDFPLPSFIPAGIWDLNIFAQAGGAGVVSFFFNVYSRNGGGSETLLFASQPAIVGNTGIYQYTASAPVPYTNIASGDALVLKLYGSNSASPTRTFSNFYQNIYYSHIHTTFSQLGDTGSSGISSLSTVVSYGLSSIALFTSNTSNYFSSQIVSTNNNLISTVAGLGSANYVSTLSLVSTTAGILANVSITGVLSTANLTSTVQGLGSANYVSTLSLVSTTQGLQTGYATAGFLSTPNLTSTVQGLGSANYVSTLSLVSTTQGLQTGYATAGFLSTPNLTSTVQGLGSANYVSTLSLVSTTQGLQTGYATAGFLSTANLTSTVQGLGSANYVSTLSLVSTTQGLQTGYATAGFLSTPNLTSTVQGLGSANYVSTLSLVSTTQGLQTGYATAGFLSTANLTSTVQGLGSANYVSTLSLVSTTQGLQTGYATAGFLSTPNLTSTVAGLGTAGYVSTTALGAYFSSVSTSYAVNFITSSLTFSTATGSNATISTVTTNQLTVGSNGGWLLTGAIQTAILSSVQINTNLLYTNSNFFGTVSSQTALQFYGLQGNYNNTVIAEQSTGTGTQELLLFKGSSASDQVRIQTTGGFRLETGVSSRLWPTYAQAANPALYVDINSNVGIGTASPGALLDVVGQGRFQVVSTLQLNISSINGATFGSPINSTVIGLGSAGYVSTLSLVSTTAGILANFSITGVLSTANLTSTVAGLGSAGYISSSQLISTVAGLNTYTSSFIDAAELTSTISSLGTLGYVSTLSLVSTTQGLQTGYATAGFLSTANLTSTVQGLGSANYVSTLSLVSTTQGLQTGYATAGFLSTPNLTSTVQGLGTAGYLSSTALGPYFSSLSTSYALNFITSSLTFSTATGSNATISTVTTNQFTVGSNGGWILAGALQTVVLSSVQINTNVLYANSNFFGTVSSQTALQFYGLQGNYNNTVIAEQSTGTGTQELLLFKGSSASDQVRIQTTGGFRLETGVSSRLWPTYAQAANPALYVDINSNVGIGTASPGALLDVVGQGRFQVVSTLQLNISSINGATFGSPINSTVIGLGSAGYVSTLSLVSTTAGILANFSITGVLSTANLTSTVAGLGSAGYISSSQLISTVAGLNTYTSSFIDAAELTSTISSLGTLGYVSTLSLVSTTQGLQTGYATAGFLSTANLTSTVQGLGSANYVSTLSLVSTTAGILANVSITGVLSTANLTSTVQGLGSSGYISSFQNILSISSQQIVASSIGIGCNAPFYTLDINGSAHATVFSSVSLLTSSFFGTLADATTVVVYDV